jgi:hypothetical protein
MRPDLSTARTRNVYFELVDRVTHRDVAVAVDSVSEP